MVENAHVFGMIRSYCIRLATFSFLFFSPFCSEGVTCQNRPHMPYRPAAAPHIATLYFLVCTSRKACEFKFGEHVHTDWTRSAYR